MGKTELVQKMADKAEITKAAAEKALSAVLEAILESAKQGETVRMIGFGTFSVVERAARTGRNPGTGKEIQIPAKKVLKFKPSSTIELEAHKPSAQAAAKKPAAKAGSKKVAAKKPAPKKK